MKKYFMLFGCVIMLFAAQGVSAQYGQYGSYGTPSEPESIIVDKRVAYPYESKGKISYAYVDNLGVSDFNFAPQKYVFFKIIVTNTSNTTLKNVVVKDTLPMYLEYFDNVGSYDAKTNTITISVGTMAKDEVREYTFSARVKPASSLPAGKSIMCVSNIANASTGSAHDEDTASFCITNKVSTINAAVAGTTTKGGITKAKTIPAAGSENIIVSALAPILGYIGLRLRRKTY